MVAQSVRLPDELAKKLERAAKASKRSKSSFIVEALENYLADREDLEIALARIREPKAEWITHAKVKRALDLD